MEESACELATVLVVDDNDAALELTRITLLHSKLRCNLMSASGGEEALETLRAAAEAGQCIDLVLLDVNMPRLDGFSVLASICGDQALPRPAIIMCSSLCDGAETKHASALGALGMVEKPPRLDALRALLSRAPHLRFEDDAGGGSLLRVARAPSDVQLLEP